MNMRAAIYARVSTEDQAREGYSLDAQIDMLRAYCESEEWVIAEEYVDEGYSGRDTKRPAYRRMLEEAEKWDIIVVIKMDRIHRNSMNFMNMMEFLESNDKKFASSTESLDTSNALGRFVVDMIQRIAQLESEQISERTYMGMREKAESAAGIMGFNPPFGYRIHGNGLEVIEEELFQVCRIFSMYLEGHSVDKICYILNREGVRTRRGNIWNKQNLRNILHNPVYSGYMRWDDVLIPHSSQTAVSPSDFNEVQERMASKTRGRKPALIKVPEYSVKEL